MPKYLIKERKDIISWRYYLSKREEEIFDDIESSLYYYKEYKGKFDNCGAFMRGYARGCMSTHWLRTQSLIRRVRGLKTKYSKMAMLNNKVGPSSILTIEVEDGIDPVDFCRSIGIDAIEAMKLD